MGLIRNAAIVAVAITLIPSDPQDRAHIYAKAHDGVRWATTFCERNKQTCIHGGELRDAFLEKAAFAASSAYDIAVVHLTGTADRENLDTISSRTPARQPQVGTLTGFDRQTAWRGHR